MLVTDLDGDGEPEVMLGGVNDAPEYANATVVIFDHRWISGASINRSGVPQFQALAPGTEKSIIRFPRTPLSQNLEFNRVREIVERGSRIIVIVVEGTDERAPCVDYEFT